MRSPLNSFICYHLQLIIITTITIKILLYTYTQRMAALCTFVVMDELFCCVWRLDPAECAQLGWSSSSGVPGSGSSTSQVLIASSAHVPVSQLLLIYDDYPRSCLPCFLVPPCLPDRLVAGYLWCTVTDVLFAQILSSCASSSSRANWSYYAMYSEDAIRFRITLTDAM